MSVKCTITIVDEVNTMITGLTEYDEIKLYEQFGVYTPGYRWNNKFKLGVWDGKIRFFKKNGATSTYLLDEIIPFLVKNKYEISVNDLRDPIKEHPELIDKDIFAHITHPEWGVPIILRDYQVNLVNELLSTGYGIGIAATGAGKTFMTAALALAYERIGLRTLTIVPDITLVRQTKDEMVMLQLDAGEYSGTVKEVDNQHLVSTWQSLGNNPNLVRGYGAIIVDEAHKAKSQVLNNILVNNAAKIPFRFGVTGTLPEHDVDKMTVACALGPVRYEIPAHELIDAGVLSTIHIDLIVLEENLKPQYKIYEAEHEKIKQKSLVVPKITYAQFKKQYFPDFTNEKDYLNRSKTRLQWIANEAMKRRDNDGNTMILVNSVKTARDLGKLIPDSFVINGTDVKKVEDRKKVYDKFKERDDLVVIATVHVASTGLNINRMFNLILVDIGKSFTRVIQSIGRGLRTAKDKSHINLVDISSDLEYGSRHTARRIKMYKEAQYPYTKHKIAYEES